MEDFLTWRIKWQLSLQNWKWILQKKRVINFRASLQFVDVTRSLSWSLYENKRVAYCAGNGLLMGPCTFPQFDLRRVHTKRKHGNRIVISTVRFART